MNRTSVKRLAIGTLAFTFALSGLYISTARSVRAATAPAQQVEKAAGESKQGSAPAVEPQGKRHSEGSEAKERRIPPIVTEAASVLGMDESSLLQQLKAGKSIAEIAQAKGISESELTSKLLKLRIARIDEAVKAGKLDAVRAETMKQRMGSHLTFMVKEKGLFDRNMMQQKRHSGLKPAPEQLASLLGISEPELKAQLKAGKSLADIAASRGISRDQLIAKLKEQMTPQLEQWVDRKHMDKAVK